MEAVAPVAAAGPPVLSRSRHHLSFNAPSHSSHVTHYFPLTIPTAQPPLSTFHSPLTCHSSLPHHTNSLQPCFNIHSSQVHFLSHITNASQLYFSNYLLQTLFSWTHNLLHTIVHRHNLSPTIFDTPFFTHTFVTLYVSPTSLSHITFDTSLFPQLCHRPPYGHHLSNTSYFTWKTPVQNCHTLSWPHPHCLSVKTFLAHYWRKLSCGVIRSFICVHVFFLIHVLRFHFVWPYGPSKIQ